MSEENPAQVPIARPRSPSGKLALMIARLLGTSSAPPIPCTARAAISIPAPGAIPQATEAAVKTATPITKILRRPNRSPAAPPTRISALNISM